MSLESAAREMLTSSSAITLVTDPKITHGFRLQETTLPAITFELQETQLRTLGTNPLRSAVMQISCVADSTLDAIAIGNQVRSAARSGTFDAIQFHAVVEQGFAVEPPTVADGDEAQPATYTLTFTLTYQE